MAKLVIIIQCAFNPIIFSIFEFQIYLASTLISIFFIINIVLPIHLSSKTNDSLPNLVFFVFTTLFIISVLFFGFKEYTLSNFIRLIMLLVACRFLMSFEKNYKELTNFYFTISVVYSIYLNIIFLNSGFDIVNRISPIGQGRANAFAASLALVCLLRLSIYDEFSKSSNRFVIFIGLPVMIFTIVGTFSRGAIVGFTVGLLVIIRQRITVGYLPKIMNILIVFLILFQLFGTIRLTIFSRYSASNLFESRGRDIIFRNALNAFYENPFLGAGFGAKLNPFTTGEASTHNVFLQALGETGFLGILILLISIGAAIFRYRPKISASALSCLFVVSLTDNHFLAVQFHIVLGLIYLFILRDKELRN
jgi:O-antigen ligase